MKKRVLKKRCKQVAKIAAEQLLKELFSESMNRRLFSVKKIGEVP